MSHFPNLSFFDSTNKLLLNIISAKKRKKEKKEKENHESNFQEEINCGEFKYMLLHNIVLRKNFATSE